MREMHSIFGGREWRVTPQGVETRDGLTRTRGEPRTMRLYWAFWAQAFFAASRETGVPVPVLLMTVATENGPAVVKDRNVLSVIPIRKEPGYTSDDATPHRISVGPCHVLISTARSAMGDPSIDRAWLLNPANNIRAAAAYIASQRPATGFDPVLVAAAYNAGSLKEARPGSRYGNPWHLRAYGNHLDRAAQWYGDACAMIEEAAQLAGRAA